MNRSYLSYGALLCKGGGPTLLVRDLQTDLRRLGYLGSGIDGHFGPNTEAAVRALQSDLLTNTGRGPDGAAPVAIRSYNRSRVTECSGVLDQNLAACIADMLDDGACCKIPSSEHPQQDNQRIMSELAALELPGVPLPFLLAIFEQETGLKHFREPTSCDADNFVVVGLDRPDPARPAITSRGYGVGQYTLFHHPPSRSEVDAFILSPSGNIRQAVLKLRDKFDHFLNGPTAATRAADRSTEHGTEPLRLCCYSCQNPLYLKDCRNCLQRAGIIDVRAGLTPLHDGTRVFYAPTACHPETEYRGVPLRSAIGCDWPYAVRRYNGGGLDSYHYQTKVLLRVLNG